jgi:hypothetical protein
MIMISELLFTSIILSNLITIISFISSVCIFIFFKYYSYYVFDSISDSINTTRLLKKIKNNGGFISQLTVKDGSQEPTGLCINFKEKYIAFVENYNVANNFNSKMYSKIYIIGKCPIDIKAITNNNNNDDEDNNDYVKIYLSSQYHDGSFKEISLPFKNFEPYDCQQKIIEKIVESYKDNKFFICRSLIYGKPKRGKSFIGKLLAHKFKSAYCFDIKLDNPGTQVLNLWNTFKPDENRPLIVQIDEFDILIKKCHEQKIENNHEWMKTMIYDKQSYNTFISEYLICLPYVIYLFTMNSTPEEINKLDTSYIRQNRIDLLQEL